MMLPDLWELAAIVSKFALYLGALTAAGTVLAAVVFRLPLERRFASGFAVLGLLATVAGFAIAAASLTGDASGMVDPVMLQILWSTPVGTAAALRLAGLVLVIAGLWFAGAATPRASLRGAMARATVVLGAGMALISFAQTGHIASRDSAALGFVLTAHLIAIALWIGVLSPLRALALDAGRLNDASALGRRFGALASSFVPVLIVAGGYMGYLLTGSWSALFGSAYGQALVIKVMAVSAMLALAAANKLRFVPRMEAQDRAAARHLARSIRLEWGLVLVVLSITAILTTAVSLPT